jgi:hypothetical protein
MVVGVLCRIQAFCGNDSDLIKAIEKLIYELQFRRFEFKTIRKALMSMAKRNSSPLWMHVARTSNSLWNLHAQENGVDYV